MLYNALIRTHHITSRKKVSLLKRAADTHNCFVLLRSGGVPGIMYVEGREEEDVETWVGFVKGLKYKDFQLVSKPGVLVPEQDDDDGGGGDGKSQGQGKSKSSKSSDGKGKKGKSSKGQSQAQVPSDTQENNVLRIGLDEVESVKDFGNLMAHKGIWRWWRRGMGYDNSDD